VPLLPKPTASSQLQTFALVPVPQGSHDYANLHIVAAKPSEEKSCTADLFSQDGNCVFLSVLDAVKCSKF